MRRGFEGWFRPQEQRGELRSPVPELKPGSEVTFAINSPALVFGDDPQTGKAYEFDLCRKIRNGEVKFSQLGVRFNGGTLGSECDSW